MRASEWILALQEKIGQEFVLSQLPLGEDEQGRIVLSHRKNRQDRYCHTCVTGRLRTSFIVDTVATLAACYGEGKASFFILSQKKEYAKLLAIKGADITVPYLRTEKQFLAMKEVALTQANARKQKPD
ncbi:MAG: hypothetical protein IJX18_02515, partial [Clostridia bacterium]|nr:hypothetical protein [Clostridia bacterium]